MTQEEKELLLKDLCARLPYKVKIGIEYEGEQIIKPYLRPMSSMTEEEREEYYKTGNVIYDYDSYSSPAIDAFEMTYESYDWLNEKGFDYRGLIPMGLALEAPEDMYK